MHCPPAVFDPSDTPVKQQEASEEGAMPVTVEQRSQLFREFIQTTETTKMTYILEGHYQCANAIALVGETGAGKSWLSTFALNSYLRKNQGRYYVKQLFFYRNTNADSVVKALDGPLDKT
jgi:polynucleotide 5'-kinase involved in rRNA processing